MVLVCKDFWGVRPVAISPRSRRQQVGRRDLVSGHEDELVETHSIKSHSHLSRAAVGRLKGTKMPSAPMGTVPRLWPPT